MSSEGGFTEMEKQALLDARGGAEKAPESGGEALVDFGEFVAQDENTQHVQPASNNVSAARDQDSEANQEILGAIRRAALGDQAPAQPSEQKPKESSFKYEGAGSGIKNCPLCGWDLSKSTVSVPTTADKEEFIRSVLGARSFEKSFSFLGGKVNVLLRATTVEEEDEIVKELSKRTGLGEIKLSAEWLVLYRKFRLPFMLKQVEIDSDSKMKFEAPNLDEMDMDKAVDQIVKKWPTTFLSFVGQAQTQFDDVYSALLKRGNDPDFWGRPSSS